jgi:tetratricopeptide (TPR) repeat protein
VRDAFLRRARVTRRAILLALAAGVPVLFVRANNDPINVPKLSFLMAGVSIALALRLAEWLQGEKPEGLTRLGLPAAAFVIPLLWGWLFSPYKGWALLGDYGRFQGLIPYLLVIVYGVLIADAFTDDRRLPALALIWAGATVGLYAVVQVIGLDPIEWSQAGVQKRWAGSTLGNPNFTGGFLGIVVPLAAGLFIDGRHRRTVMWLGPLIAAGWILSFSQGGWAAGAAGLSAALGWISAARWSPARWVGSAIALVVAGAALGQVLLGIVAPQHPLVPATVQLRSYAYQAAADMTLEHPLTGRGPNAFAIEGVQHRTLEDARLIHYNFPDEPHNVLLGLSAGTGLLGAIGFILAAGWILMRARSLPGDDVIAAALFGAIVAYFVQSLVSIDELSLRVALWTALGAFAATTVVKGDPDEDVAPRPSSRKRKKRVRTPLRAPLAVLALGLVALAVTWWAGSYAVADARVWQGTLLAVTGDIEAAQEQFELAIGFKDDSEFKSTYGLRIAAVALRAGDPGRSYYEDAVSAFDYLDGLPHLPSLAEYARVLYAGAIYDPAYADRSIEVYDRMQALDPLNPAIRAEVAGVLIDLGREEEAFARLEPVMREGVGRRNADVWGVVALASALTGDEDQARRAARRALDLDPAEPRALRALEILDQDGT